MFDAIRIMRQEKISIIESHGYKTHVIAAIVKVVTGARWIAFSHGWTAENAKVKLYHALDRVMLRFADLNVTVAPNMRDTVKKIAGHCAPVEMILNAIEVGEPPSAEARTRVRGEFNVAPDTVLLGCFGRMSREKGQGILLDALARMKPKRRVEALFVGDGVDLKMVQEKTASLGLVDRVHFAGYQKNIAPYYAAIDALVLPSLSEGTPNVMLEAMASGVPVVSSDVGAVREAIVENETGWLVPPGDAAPLAAALMRASDDEAARARVASAAKKALYPKFDPKARADRIVSLYERVTQSDSLASVQTQPSSPAQLPK